MRRYVSSALVSWALAGLVCLGLCGCPPTGEQGLREAFSELKRNPSEKTTRSFLKWGQKSVQMLEALPEGQRSVEIWAESRCRGRIAPGAPEGCIRLLVPVPPGEGTLEIPLDTVRVIYLKTETNEATDSKE